MTEYIRNVLRKALVDRNTESIVRTSVASIRLLMDTLHLTVDQAMKVLEIPEEEKQTILDVMFVQRNSKV